jgi:anaerobic selenocysteine-containing dehydrogenase
VANIDALAHLVRPYSPERVARRTGVAPDVTRRIAGEFARTTRAACYGRVGLCTQKHGTLASWLVQVLNVVTGHLDEVGGMMLTTPAVDAVAIMSRLGMRGSFGRWRSRARHLPEFSGDPPIATLADEIELDGPGQVRALVTIAGNPVLSAPNGRRLDRALGTLEHVVSIDGYLNETTRHAHVLLPPAPPLSRAHYDLALYAFAVRNVAKYNEPVVPQQVSERLDWEIVTELAGRVFVPRPLRRIALRAAHHVRPERIVDALLRVGPHRLTLAQLRRFPHGLDLGPLEPGRFKDRIATPDRMADLAPKDLVREAEAQLPAEADRDATDELLLIGRRQLRDNNSWMHNSRRLVKGPSRCTLLIHPSDAASRHLADGDLARLGSDVGTIVVPVEVTDAMRPGVVSLPHGWGHDREGVRLDTAREHAGASMNDVTSDHHLDTISGNAGFSGLPVTLVRTGG